ncbi:MAG: MnhB domain-containing protein [Kiritimatiellae bacterium]|nr:MnhB domain-containing protein [Kiritimatiellia bacterium]
MIDLRDSPPLDTTLRLLFPFVLVFSFQLFSYGANSPGGGFQAGVAFGTIVVVLDLVWRRRAYPDRIFERMELAGLLLLGGLLLAGWLRTGRPFPDPAAWTGPGLLFSNIQMWSLNLAIFLEVAGSIVLIVRRLREPGK